MSSSKRIYRVGDHLVKAASPSVALAHVARNTINVRVATQDDLIELRDLGVPVQNAGDDWQKAEAAKAASAARAEASIDQAKVEKPDADGGPLRIMLADDPIQDPIPDPAPAEVVIEEDSSGKPVHILHHGV